MSVADILEKLAENAGRGQLARGALIGNTIASAAAVPGQILDDREKERIRLRQQAQQDAIASYAKNADIRAGKDQALQDAAAQRDLQKQAALKAGITAGFGDSGDPKQFDVGKAAKAVTDAGYPELVTTISDVHDRLLPKLTSGAPGSVMRGPDGHVIAGSAIPDKKPDYTINGQRFSGDATPIGTVQPPQPAAAQTHNMRVKGVGDVPVDYVPKKDGSGGTWMYQGKDVTAGVTAIPAASITIHNDNAKVPTLPAWALDDTRPSGPDANKLDATVRMTPNGLFQAAQTYIATGQFPPTARGADAIAQSTRAAITSKVGAIAASSGLDEPALRSFYKSNASSLAQQQKIQDSVQGFMATADKNAALLQETLKKIPDTGIPVFNQPVRAFAKNVAGNKDLSQFATYLQSVQNEYARIITQPNLAGQLTDSARHEAETLLDPKSTVPQILGSIEALQQEGNNRLVSVGEQIQRIQKRMQVTPIAPSQSPASGTIRARDPQGVLHEAPAGTALPAGWKLEKS